MLSEGFLQVLHSSLLLEQQTGGVWETHVWASPRTWAPLCYMKCNIGNGKVINDKVYKGDKHWSPLLFSNNAEKQIWALSPTSNLMLCLIQQVIRQWEIQLDHMWRVLRWHREDNEDAHCPALLKEKRM